MDLAEDALLVCRVQGQDRNVTRNVQDSQDEPITAADALHSSFVTAGVSTACMAITVVSSFMNS